MVKNICVQYGCGLSAPKGWRNFDSSPTLRLQKMPFIGKILTRGRVKFPDNVEFGDVAAGLPIDDASVDFLYCSHVLEHLSLYEFRLAVNESFRILKSGGVFRGVLPDLEYYVKVYGEARSPDAAPCFMRETMLGEERRRRGVGALATALFGNSQHRWMWDFSSLEAEFEQVGFVGVRRAIIGDEYVDVFEAVEEESRWRNCLGFQARRP